MNIFQISIYALSEKQCFVLTDVFKMLRRNFENVYNQARFLHIKGGDFLFLKIICVFF